MLRVFGRQYVTRRAAADVLVIDLHDLLAGRLVARLGLGCRLRSDRLSLAAPHHLTVLRVRQGRLTRT